MTGAPFQVSFGGSSARADRPALAEVRAAGQAVLAVAAEDRQAGDDVVARLELVDVRADRLDDAGRLVAEDGRRRERVEALDEVQVAVADAAGHRAHEHLAPDGLGDVDVLDRERLVGTVEDGSLHVVLLCSMVGAGRRGQCSALRLALQRPALAGDELREGRLGLGAPRITFVV